MSLLGRKPNTPLALLVPTNSPADVPMWGPPFLIWVLGTVPRTINLGAVLILLLGGAVVAVSVHFVHGFQLSRNAAYLLEEAKEAQASDRLEEARETLASYLELNPTDTDARFRYGLLLHRAATSPQGKMHALLVLEKALRGDRSRNDIRWEIVKIDLEKGIDRFEDAEEHLDVLRKALLKDGEPASKHGELEYWSGRCAEGKQQYADAEVWYKKAIGDAPKHTDSYIRLATLQRARLEKPERADLTIESMLGEVRSAPAYLEAAKYYGQAVPSLGTDAVHVGAVAAMAGPGGNMSPVEAVTLIRTTFTRNNPIDLIDFAINSLGGTDAELFLLGAEIEQRQNRQDRARQLLEEGLRITRDAKLALKDENRFALALAAVELDQDETAQALARLKRLIVTPPSEVEQLAQLGNLLVDGNAIDEAQKVIEWLRRQHVPVIADYLSARVLILAKRWREAEQLLEAVIPQLAQFPAWPPRANLLLAQCYANLDDPDQEVMACRRALSADRNWLPAQRALASALTKLQQWKEAVEVYGQMPESPARNLALAHVLIQYWLRRPAAERRWADVEKLLHLPAEMLNQSKVLIVEAELRLAQGDTEEARNLLERACADPSHPVEPWLRLAKLAKQVDALVILEKAKRRLGDRWELQQARIDRLAQTRGDDTLTRLRSLESSFERFKPAEKHRLLFALAESLRELGDVASAARLWNELAEAEPAWLNVRLRLVDAAARAGEQVVMERLLREIEQIEGGRGPAWSYAEGARLACQAEKGDKTVLAEARQHAAKAAKQRPLWAAAVMLEGRILDLQDNVDAALECYLRAIELGMDQPAVAGRAIDLLTQKRRFAQAQALLDRLPDVVKAGLSRQAAELALLGAESQSPGMTKTAKQHALDLQHAWDLARSAVPADSTDYHDYLWLARMAIAADRARDAEGWLRQAVALARRHLARDQVPLALASCYEALGQTVNAQQQYEAALAARPDDIVVLQNAGEFFSRTPGRGAEAEACLRKLLTSSNNRSDAVRARARRNLALVIAAPGNYVRNQEARALLQQNLQENPDSPDDRCAQAEVFARSGPPFRQEAIKLLEGLAKVREASPDERFLLAQLYEAVGRASEAASLMSSLSEAAGAKPAHVAHQVALLLRGSDLGRGEKSLAKSDLDRAKKSLDKLAAIEPQSLRTAELKACLLHASGDTRAAVQLLSELGRSKTENIPAVAAVLEGLAQAASAEKLYREYAAKSQDPERVLPLAASLGRQGRVDDALALCEQAWQTCTAEAVLATALPILRTGLAKDLQFAAVEKHLHAALVKGSSPGLLWSTAELQEIQGHYTEAIAAYRAVLANDPQTVPALNNLGWLLALHARQADEARELLDRAIQVAGSDPHLLDTRGVVQLALWEPQAALQDLKEASQQMPIPQVYFHLAQACLAKRDEAGAREAFRQAQKLGLSVAKLHPLERNAYRELKADLRIH
jgi:tetratricopeptide (TPR) repeat protein/Tfp pilus assembly protein PilF